MATIQYARLYPDTTQLQAKDGHNLTAGWVMVFLAGTDDPAVTYADFNGTVNPQKIVIDDNGRFCAIVDKAKAYRVEVYDSEGMLQWTTEPVWCTGNAGSGMSVTRVVSTDGSISVEENIAGTERTYDIGIAPADNDEFLEWIKCSEEDCDSTWKPVYQAGTMETEAGQGIKVHGGHLYHFTNTFYVDPNGTGITYDTFKVNMYCNDQIVDSRNFDIDTSVNDAVQCEFSTDVIPEADGYVYFTLVIPSTCEVTGEVQCHRIYSGINAVPDTCATKQWVQETFDYNLSGKIAYSALGYNNTDEITGISGSAIATTDPVRVSAIASSYAESAISSISGWSGDFSSISSKIDWSSSGVFQPSGDYAYNSSLSGYVDTSTFSSFSSEVTNNISSISSTVSGLTGQYIEQSASGMFQPSGYYVSASDMSAYVPFSGLEGDGVKITGISGSAIKGHEYTGINPVSVDNTADTISVYHKTLCVDGTMTAYNSGSSAVIGVNIESLDLSSKMDASASSLFYSTSNPSGFITGVDLTPYQLTADMSAYQPSGDYAYNSAVSAKLDASASSEFQPSGDYYSASNPSGFITGVDLSPYQLTADMSAYQPSGDYAYNSAVSSKLDASASSDFYLTSNPSGFITGVDLSPYQLTADMSAYQPSGDYAFNSSLSSKLDASASSDFYSTANPSGFITGVDLSPYQLTADMSAYQLSGDYAYNSAVSAKLDASASSEFQPSGDYYSASNPSGFITGVDLTPYQLTADMSGYYTTANESGFIDSAYVESQVSGKQDVSGMTAYQPAGDYQPSGDYIYVSALGWAEV